jgi:uncharacterized Tic20 family protein
VTTQIHETIGAEERNWAMFANLAGLFVFVHVPLANVIGPLVIYLSLQDRKMPFALEHARRSLNFQVTFSILYLVAISVFVAALFGSIAQYLLLASDVRDAVPPFSLIFWGALCVAFLLIAVAVNVIFCIAAAVAASSGRTFHYPAIAFVR